MDTFKDKQQLEDAVRARATRRGRSGSRVTPRSMHRALARRARRPAAAGAVPRRPLRRHRDRLRRDGPAPGRASIPALRVHWVVLSGARAARARRRGDSAAALPRRAPSRPTSCVERFRDGFFPYERRPRSRTRFEALKARGRRPTCPHPPPRGPPPGPPPGRRADLEHLPRPPDPRVRDPQVRRRPRPARTCSCRSAASAAERKVELLLRVASPARRGRSWFTDDTFRALLRLRGIECNAPERLRRGVPRPQARPLMRRRPRASMWPCLASPPGAGRSGRCRSAWTPRPLGDAVRRRPDSAAPGRRRRPAEVAAGRPAAGDRQDGRSWSSTSSAGARPPAWSSADLRRSARRSRPAAPGV